jgi:hypothetical protein
MFRKAKMSTKEGMEYLISKGLNSIPGGGAEIFDEATRLEIAGDKCDSAKWLEIHQTAHECGIRSNCTMLYGHIETYAHRVDHMRRLRELQDQTKGFQTFIPLKFRNSDNDMSHVPEVSLIEDLKVYAIARIYLDNFDHVKAYWPMLGRSSAQLTQSFGVDDLDGTIDDSTKIYSMAGSEEQNPTLSTDELIDLIRQAGRTPVERDTLYNTIKIYQADDDYQIRKYSHAEDMIKSVSANKKLDKDYLDIKNKLTFIYDLNTLKFSLICFSAICLMLLNKNSQFILPNLGISACIIFICLLINRLARNINIARWLVVVFFSIQLGYAAYISIIQSNEIRAEYLKDAEFDNFKKDKIIISIDNNDESLFSYIDFPRGVSGQAILLDEQQNVDNPYYSFVVKPGFIEEWYSSEVKIPNFLVTEQRRVYSDENLIEIISGISDPNYKIILRDWEKRLQFYARVSDLYVIELVAVAFLFNDKESFEKNQTYIVHMPKFIYELLKQKKAINKYNFSNAPSISILESGIFKNLNNSLTIGQSYQGGIIVKIDESGQHGYVMSIEDLGMSNWYKANDLCNNYSYDSFDDWSLPNIEELREIYGLKNQVSNFQENWYSSDAF